MNWNLVEDSPEQLQGNVRWGELIHGRTGVNGRRHHPVKTYQSYRTSKEEAERRLRVWESSLD